MAQYGYPHLSSALVMCSTSFSLSSGSDTMLLHLSSNVLMTHSFWCNGWRNVKFRYWSVCVFFRYSRSFTVPSSFRIISVSRKGSSSYVNLMLPAVYMLLRCSVSSCSHPFFTTSIISSTYLFHNFGLQVIDAVRIACCSSQSMKRFAITSDTGFHEKRPKPVTERKYITGREQYSTPLSS